jgi:GntR family transcriptional regulator
MSLNSQNRSPLYHQIYLILRARILDGEYQPGDYLPGERELEGMFQVSRITAVRALNDLASQGLVVRERGRGTRVQMFVGSGIVARGPTGTAEKSPSRVRGGTNDELDALHRNGRAQVTLCDFDYVEATASVAEALGLAEGDLVQHAIRVWRFKDARPFNYVQTYVPEDIGRRWSRADMEKRALQRLFAQHGIEIALVQEQITATLADMLLSRQLEVEAGSPILKIRRIAYDIDGRPVEFLTGYYPPDRYQYEVTLPRRPATGSE